MSQPRDRQCCTSRDICENRGDEKPSDGMLDCCVFVFLGVAIRVPLSLSGIDRPRICWIVCFDRLAAPKYASPPVLFSLSSLEACHPFILQRARDEFLILFGKHKPTSCLHVEFPLNSPQPFLSLSASCLASLSVKALLMAAARRRSLPSL